jgi:hypothetical protein
VKTKLSEISHSKQSHLSIKSLTKALGCLIDRSSLENKDINKTIHHSFIRKKRETYTDIEHDEIGIEAERHKNRKY